ncbi:MAG: nodulation protein NfeD [Candidatus Eisenbacteria bacterium]|uniref:Nodulation protein NfeD n=1 Tax=Eiseniibacteriota bacterium TaxID=2212470 RepID=A0A7Y2EAY0_UNCEI|nr:nodulation protein NfeD [Candidatus Eisenbacteria bacterium]
MKRLSIALGLLSLLLGLATPSTSRAQVVHWLVVDDIIGPISADYMLDAIKEAETAQAEVLVFELDTPGGLMDSMRSIIKGILASDVPVAVYIAPEGARAASAGTFIALSAHIAAMAPGTNLGAASPVAGAGGEMDSTMASKVFNDAEAYIRSLARTHDRNEEWAASAVRSAESLPASEAVEQNVVDFIANSPEELLAKMDGREVKMAEGKFKTLSTAQATIETKTLTQRYKILSLLNNPTISYLLLMLGFYGLFFELSNPGAIFPGVAGSICLILGLLGLQTLSISYAGLLLMIVALVLFFLETQITSHGLLTVGGAGALLAGSLMLFESPAPFLRVSMQVALPTVLLSLVFFGFAILMALRAQKRRVVSGEEALVGLVGEVRKTLDPEGTIFVAGEHWTAVSESSDPLPVGVSVEVVAVDRLTLHVKPVSS